MQTKHKGKKQGLWGASRKKSKVQKEGQNQVIRQTRAIQKSRVGKNTIQGQNREIKQQKKWTDSGRQINRLRRTDYATQTEKNEAYQHKRTCEEMWRETDLNTQGVTRYNGMECVWKDEGE